MEDAIPRMTAPSPRTFAPVAAESEARHVYDALYSVYCDAAAHFGRAQPQFMKQLKKFKEKV